MNLSRILCIAPMILLLTACDVMLNRIGDINRPPDFKQVKTYNDYTNTDQYTKAKAEQASHGNSIDDEEPKKYANSLWQPGARTFFRDLRARAIGDILKVKVTIQDNAKLDNKSERKRDGSATTGVPSLFGYEKKFDDIVTSAVDPSKLISIKSNDNHKGEGKVDRKETINTTIAATVVKILPNNNLYIKGTQEIRVNYELREITVDGIVRPEDISAENSVTLDQIAEARISYGGRGQLNDYQQDRYGKQILDIISPF